MTHELLIEKRKIIVSATIKGTSDSIDFSKSTQTLKYNTACLIEQYL